MGKRSPILGFNHNVLYRGLVFHVQTEDSGVASPHLFTHLFHSGVIVSTRKLVYDAGSAEESIKSLMQAQHKATLKDLRKGHFDDKIDSYLGGTPGLLPRGTDESAARPGEGELASASGVVEELAVGAPTQQVEPLFDELSAPEISILEKTPPPARPSAPALPTAAARSSAARAARAAPAAPVAPVERPLTPDMFRAMPVVDTTLKTEMPAFESSPDIRIEVELPLNLDDSSDTIAIPRRMVRDTEAQAPFTDQTRPTLDVRLDEHSKPTLGRLNEPARRATSVSDGVPPSRPSSPAIPPPSSDSRRLGDRSSSPVIPPLPSDSRRLGDRPSTINAATLPPARPISRPAARQALTPPPILSRAATSDERSHRDPEATEVLSAAQQPVQPAADLPPGERPGQYAQHKKGTPRHATEVPRDGARNDRLSGAAIPAGLGRPQRVAAAAAAKPNPAPSVSGSSGSSGSSGPTSPTSPHAPSGASPARVARAPSPPAISQIEPVQARTPTPARISPPGVSRTGGGANNGVVMTRPAVIVGAPAKSVGTVPRIRKAREEEGRGFGQGLISEKSLDEVILAYLSEDADEK